MITTSGNGVIGPGFLIGSQLSRTLTLIPSKPYTFGWGGFSTSLLSAAVSPFGAGLSLWNTMLHRSHKQPTPYTAEDSVKTKIKSVQWKKMSQKSL